MDKYFGWKGNGVFKYIGLFPQYTTMHGVPPAEVIELKVTLHPDQSKPTKPQERGAVDYWGWQDEGKTNYTMIYPSWAQFCMCFPYGYEAEENGGKGKAFRLIVKEA